MRSEGETTYNKSVQSFLSIFRFRFDLDRKRRKVKRNKLYDGDDDDIGVTDRNHFYFLVF